jgi:hypothetical protein
LVSATENTPCRADLRPRLLVGEGLGGQLANFADRLGVIEPVAPGVEPEGLDLSELVESNFREVGCFVGHGHFRYGGSLSR